MGFALTPEFATQCVTNQPLNFCLNFEAMNLIAIDQSPSGVVEVRLDNDTVWWATRLLREHLTLGDTVNRQRFEDNPAELEAQRGAISYFEKFGRAPAPTLPQRGKASDIARSGIAHQAVSCPFPRWGKVGMGAGVVKRSFI